MDVWLRFGLFQLLLTAAALAGWLLYLSLARVIEDALQESLSKPEIVDAKQKKVSNPCF
ncbi:MAG: hypothetical protein ACRERU_18900 [Methylococcales bacterium]